MSGLCNIKSFLLKKNLLQCRLKRNKELYWFWQVILLQFQSTFNVLSMFGGKKGQLFFVSKIKASAAHRELAKYLPLLMSTQNNCKSWLGLLLLLSQRCSFWLRSSRLQIIMYICHTHCLPALPGGPSNLKLCHILYWQAFLPEIQSGRI